MGLAENTCPTLAIVLGAVCIVEGFLMVTLIDTYLEQETHNTQCTNYKPTNMYFDRAMHRFLRPHILTYFPGSPDWKENLHFCESIHRPFQTIQIEFPPVLVEKPEACILGNPIPTMCDYVLFGQLVLQLCYYFPFPSYFQSYIEHLVIKY